MNRIGCRPRSPNQTSPQQALPRLGLPDEAWFGHAVSGHTVSSGHTASGYALFRPAGPRLIATVLVAVMCAAAGCTPFQAGPLRSERFPGTGFQHADFQRAGSRRAAPSGPNDSDANGPIIEGASAPGPATASPRAADAPSRSMPIIRGQDPGPDVRGSEIRTAPRRSATTPGSDRYSRFPVSASGATDGPGPNGDGGTRLARQPGNSSWDGYPAGRGAAGVGPGNLGPGNVNSGPNDGLGQLGPVGLPPNAGGGPGFAAPGVDPLTGGVPDLGDGSLIRPLPSVDIDAVLEESRTGRFMIGAGVNSEAGVTGQIVLDERNFDITKFPRSFQDFVDGTALRGAGQGLRIEAIPGNRVQRYLVSFTEPYFLSTPLSLNLSGSYYTRQFPDWTEQRLGGRVGFGYRLAPDLSLGAALRAEKVKLFNPSVRGVPQLDDALGGNDVFGARFTLTHDTRDTPFLATEGHLLELSYEQVFGSFDFPRGEIDYRRYFLIRERADGSGRHTLSGSVKLGFAGADTPIFENYFIGGFSTIRGFNFRGASPIDHGIRVGGRFLFLGSAEYMFPLTADDMIRAVAFCDFGTAERNTRFDADTFRVAPGVGLRISIPALGPAPLALDLAFPVAHASFDNIQNFSFFFGFQR